MRKNDGLTASELWQRYENGLDWMRRTNLVERTERAHRFYIGDQWHGIRASGELPVYNFIKPIVRYKVATVSQNLMVANYSPMDGADPVAMEACRQLNRLFSVKWEKCKMDSKAWSMIKDGAIQGDSYLYFGDGDELQEAQIIDNVNLFLSDERDSDLQNQRYLILRERLFVEEVRRRAEENGVEDADLITPDEAPESLPGGSEEQSWNRMGGSGGTDGKVTCLLYLYKDEEGFVHTVRSTRNVIYEPDRALIAVDAEGNATGQGLKSYPMVSFIWETKKGSARGIGEVEPLIENQLIVNKTAARREIAVKQSAFPKLAYREGAISNPASLETVGGKIAVKDANAQAVGNMIAYLNPSQISPDAKALVEEVIYQSRELAGAGDAAMGSIDPTQASGTAIIAVRDQSALPLNEQVARYQQLVEDIALLWYDLWCAYEPNGLRAETAEGEILIPREVLQEMKVQVKVDVGQANPYSRMAQEQTLGNLLTANLITFEEYVRCLPEGSAAPKGQLEKLLEERKAAQAAGTAMQGQQMQAEQTQVQAPEAVLQMLGTGMA